MIAVPDPARLAALTQIDCVAIVGASGTGKSTLVRALKASGLPVEVPPRVVTRPPREGDADGENVYLTAGAFEALVAGGGLAVHWTRTLAPGRVERYGFAPTAPGRLPIYSANNAWPARQNALVVGVFAPEAVRRERLQRRSGAQWARAPDELAHRMADPSESIEAWAHVVVHNHGPHEAEAAAELIRLVQRALDGKTR